MTEIPHSPSAGFHDITGLPTVYSDWIPWAAFGLIGATLVYLLVVLFKRRKNARAARPSAFEILKTITEQLSRERSAIPLRTFSSSLSVALRDFLSGEFNSEFTELTTKEVLRKTESFKDQFISSDFEEFQSLLTHLLRLLDRITFSDGAEQHFSRSEDELEGAIQTTIECARLARDRHPVVTKETTRGN